MTEGKSVGGEAPSGNVIVKLGEWQTRHVTAGKCVVDEAPSGHVTVKLCRRVTNKTCNQREKCSG